MVLVICIVQPPFMTQVVIHPIIGPNKLTDKVLSRGHKADRRKNLLTNKCMRKCWPIKCTSIFKGDIVPIVTDYEGWVECTGPELYHCIIAFSCHNMHVQFAAMLAKLAGHSVRQTRLLQQLVGESSSPVEQMPRFEETMELMEFNPTSEQRVQLVSA